MSEIRLLRLRCDHQANDGGDPIRILKVDDHGSASRLWGRATPPFHTGDPSTTLPDWVKVERCTILELKEMSGGQSLGRQMIPDDAHPQLEGGARLARFSAHSGAHYSLSYNSVSESQGDPPASQEGPAERPLNRAAVREANQRLWDANPELDERQLDMTPPDYPYRREWMQYYREALARQNEQATSGGGRVDEACRPCPACTGVPDGESPAGQEAAPESTRESTINQIAQAHGIVRRDDWGAQTPHYEDMEEDWDYTTVVLHHSGNSGETDPTEIEDKHINDRGWSDVGYHFMVGPNGSIYEGRNLRYKGAHVRGANTGKIGILVMGDFQHQWWDDDDDPTQSQIDNTVSLIRTLKSKFPAIGELGGHRDYVETDCPGDELYRRLGDLRGATGLSAP